MGSLAIVGLLSRLGWPGLLIGIGIVAFLWFSGGGTGIDPGTASLNPVASDAAETAIPPSQDPDAELVDFLSFVLDDVQEEWEEIFRLSGLDYADAQLIVFEAATQSACGGASEAIGPHYCPLDQNVYLDLDFFRDLSRRLGAPGDFAIAYVLAHEIGHHVQYLLGTMDQVQRAQASGSSDANDLSIRLELQADCFAGVWGHAIFDRQLLESGDLEEALNAAAAVGDDRIQQSTSGQINPETWTHGSAEQRMKWFQRGFDSGDPTSCDTFSGGI